MNEIVNYFGNPYAKPTINWLNLNCYFECESDRKFILLLNWLGGVRERL